MMEKNRSEEEAGPGWSTGDGGTKYVQFTQQPTTLPRGKGRTRGVLSTRLDAEAEEMNVERGDEGKFSWGRGRCRGGD